MTKRTLLFIFIAITAISLFANQAIDFGQVSNTEITSKSNSGFTANFTFERISTVDVTTERGDFTNLQIDTYAYTSSLGAPKLPALRKVIAVPFGAEVSAEMVNYEISESTLNLPVIPAQLSIEKCADAAIPEFAYNQTSYTKRGFDSKPVVRVEELGIMRGMRLFTLVFEPVKFNPNTNTIKVYNNVNVSVKFRGADNNLTAEKRANTYSPYFESAYSKTIFNYTIDRDVITNYPISYIIISDPMFEAQLQEFIEWKTEKGFNVIEAYTDDIGSTKPLIKAFIQEQYDNATAEQPAPSFVLFVGDVAEIPAYDGGEDHITDLDYVKLDGNDFLPEMYYGRFSASNTGDLQPQIDKTLIHEKLDVPDISYLGEVIMIAGMDPSFGATHGNGAINYGTQQYFNEAHGIESHTYLYPDSGSNASNIVSNVSAGVGYVNYTAHGSSISWADPSFTLSNINSLNNENMYPLVVGNCCLTNKFEVGTCFGEGWLRAENKGAVAYIGGTNSTYWDEDYYWGVGAGPITGSGASYDETGRGVYDGLFHENGEEFSSWFITAGEMIVNGNLAVTEGGGSLINYYWEIYSVMGDPSVSAYLGVPSENNASYPTTILIGMESIDITADPYSLVSLTMDGESYGTVLVDDSGSATLEFESFTTPGNATIVITAQNREPIIEVIEVIPNAGAYMVIEDFSVNGTAAYNETISLNLDLRNVGSDPATAITATLSSDDNYVTISDNALTVGDVAAETTETFNTAFEIIFDNDVPNAHSADFTLTMVSTDGTWSAPINIIIAAPEFSIGNMIIADSGNDGLLDAGETATLTVPVTNFGGALTPAIVAEMITSSTDLITIDTATSNLDALAAGETGVATFEITVDDNAEEGSVAVIAFTLSAGAYNANMSYYPSIGLVFEDFETGDFSSFEWEIGNPGWGVVNSGQASDNSMNSLNINDNQTATISLDMNVASDGELSFWKKVSSESGYDYLEFHVNGQAMGEWSGDVAWSEETFDIAAGDVTFSWTYSKDGSVSSGTDNAWVDNIIFPGGGTMVQAPIFSLSTNEIDFEEIGIDGETTTEVFTISNLGNAALTGTIDVTEDFTISATSFDIPAGENVEVEVTFAPTELIEYTGTVSISSNDTTNPEATINLIGEGVTMDANDMIPLVTELQGNYPNPFNPTTTISYALSSAENVEIGIYNIKGQTVKTLVKADQEAGYHKVVWSGSDNSNRQVASGIYFYKFKAGKTVSMKKMILMK